MRLKTTGDRHGAVTQTFHWLTAILVVASFLFGEGGPEWRVYAAERASMLSWHETLGILVFVLVVLRLIWRAFDGRPAEEPMPTWMHLASRVVHWALYAFLLGVPLTAIAGAWLEGHPVTFNGIGAIGPFFSGSHDLGALLSETHGTLGNLFMWIVGLHAAAGIFHHVVMRDRVLVSMLPFGQSPSRVPAE